MILNEAITSFSILYSHNEIIELPNPAALMLSKVSIKTLLDIPRRDEIELLRVQNFLATLNKQYEQRMLDYVLLNYFCFNNNEKSGNN